MTESSVLAVIPARYQSSRLPAKVLLDIAGHPMIEHVYRRTASASSVHGVIVATDDQRIVSAVESFGGVAVMTRSDHATGTDRIAEVVATRPCHLVVNVQGDEPLIEPETIDAAVRPLLADPSIDIGTLSRPLLDAQEFTNPHVVKVVTDDRGHALYFSRAPIPGAHATTSPASVLAAARAHLGLYVYRRDVLLRLAAMAEAPLEQLEGLEQLRALEHGMRIHVVEVQHQSTGVDTPEDLERVRQRMLATTRT
ncbi:MAG: 3-deoxy-manno-octulosonate cytidylyltransferase [Vicinamibacterales bacterium]